jgi:hypothetical protein
MLFKYGKPNGYLVDLAKWHIKPRIYCGLEPDSRFKLEYLKQETASHVSDDRTA